MRAECIKAMSSALGREMTAAEARNIEDKIVEAQHTLARTDREAYLAMTPNQRLIEAGKVAAENIKAEAAKKQQRVALTILNHDKFQNYFQGQDGLMLDSIDRTLAAKLDGHDNIRSIETSANAINTEAVRQVSDAIEELGPKWLGFAKNDNAMIPVFEEMRGKDSGIPQAKAFAQKLTGIFEALRVRYNAAGGRVGKLDDFGTPQSHSQFLVWKGGRDKSIGQKISDAQTIPGKIVAPFRSRHDDGQVKWIEDIAPLLDRSKYVRDDGRLMNDVEFNEFLEKSWESISYDGLLKDKGQIQGTGAKANRHSASRQLHFKDADNYLKYHNQYAEQSLMSTMLGHIQGMTNDIALLENYSPNPDAQFNLWLTRAKQEAAKSGIELGEINKKAGKAQLLFEEVSGARSPVHNEKWARRANAFRQWLNGRLGSAVFSSTSDEATAAITAKLNNLSASKYFIEEMKQLSSPDAMRQSRRLGLGLDTMLFAIDRYSSERIAEGFSQRVSGFIIRSSGLAWMTDARKQAFGAVMMDGIHHLTRKHKNLADLHPQDNQMLLSKGITDTDWKLWQAAEPQEVRGNKLLTSDSILKIPDDQLERLGFTIKDKQHAIDSLLGAILEETDVAVVTPGARERVLTRGKSVKGTLKGELWLSAIQFKSFPIAMITRHLNRAMGIGGKSGAYYAAQLIAGTTVMGALGVQLQEISNGRDAMDMTDPKFWAKAFAKGGGVGIFADFLFAANTQYGGSMLATMEGPSLGMAEDILGVTLGDLQRRAAGEKTNTGAALIKIIRSLTPGTSLWYTKAAMDHLIFQSWQEMASPGYLRRMEKRAQKQFRQEYWWRPGKKSPDRAPDLGRAFGK